MTIIPVALPLGRSRVLAAVQPAPVSAFDAGRQAGWARPCPGSAPRRRIRIASGASIAEQTTVHGIVDHFAFPSPLRRRPFPPAETLPATMACPPSATVT